MADEFVRIGQFEEFSTRMSGSFQSVEKRMDQGFAHAEKARENILVHVNQRFDSVNQRFDGVNQRIDDLKDSLDKRWSFQSRFVVGMFLMMLAAMVKYLFFAS